MKGAIEQMGEFAGKRFLVTGASSGIGRAVCIQLSRLGAGVVLAARNEERLGETLAQMEPGEHTLISCDLADTENVGNIIDRAGILDGMVYCAGLDPVKPLKKTTFDVLHSTMRVNFYSFVELTRCMADGKKPGGAPLRIVALSSGASTTNAASQLAYAASKAALESAIRVIAAETAKKNITVNAIRPGYVDTEMLNTTGIAAFHTDLDAHIKQSGAQPLGLIDPADVAKLALYLLSDAAKHITGTSVSINAGARF